ncbi:hypothetical protein E6H23_03370 [Candidatus Bathyarchaeota archaeon]|nr:MAG: hypothetical protein E6H23_03370 [Candidatus Bathyarchaeota archaeon]
MKQSSKNSLKRSIVIWLIKPTVLVALAYAIWFSVGAVAEKLGYGPWITIAALGVYLADATRLSKARRSVLKRAFVPTIVTTLVAILLSSPIDIVGSILTLTSLTGRSWDIFALGLEKKTPRRRMHGAGSRTEFRGGHPRKAR